MWKRERERHERIKTRERANNFACFVAFASFAFSSVGLTAFGQASGLIRQSVQPRAAQPRAAQPRAAQPRAAQPRAAQLPGCAGDEKEECTLEPGKSIRRELANGQRHTYRIRLSVDQFLRTVVEQQGIDVGIVVSGPDGKQIIDLDSESRSRAPESLSLVAEGTGDYRLMVRPIQRGAPAGSYEIRVEELRAATENDRALQDARKLYESAMRLQRAGKYDEAIPLVERALDVREKVLGPDHRDVAAALDGLAVLYWNKGDYAEVEPFYGRALAIQERSLGPEHPDVAATVYGLAGFYWNRGDYGRAEHLCRRALSIYEKALGPEHSRVALTLNGLGNLHYEKGEYAKAEPLYVRALAIFEKRLRPEHPNLALALNNLAVLYWKKGDYERAEPLYGRVLAIYQKAFGPEHPEVAGTLNNLAILYRAQGEDGRAEPLHQQALTIREKMLGPDHPDVAESLGNLANLYSSRGEYEKAEPLARRALAIWEKLLGPDHLQVSYPLQNLAGSHSSRGEYEKAEPLYERALAIQEKALGPQHPYVIESLNNLAVLYMAKGDLARAISVQSRADAISEHNLVLNLATGSERQKLAYLATLSDQTDRTISLHLGYAPGDPAARRLAATLILQRKGRALDAASETLNALRGRFNTEDRALLDQLTEKRSQLARLVLDGPQKMTAEQYRERVESLEGEAERFESQISRRSSEFRAQSLPITLEAVQAAIPPGAVLIEFASYRPFDARASKAARAYGRSHYVAYVIPHEGEIGWRELGEAKPIDEAIDLLRRALRNPRRKDVKRLARAVDDRVFRPVRTLVAGRRRLLISPEGSLNLIPFAALVDERGKYLVERYSISYLASGRDLLSLQVARESQSSPLVMANPDFGGPDRVGAARLLKQKAGSSKARPEESPAASSFSEFYFPSLPYTAQEGDALRALLPGATLLTRRRASKAALMHVRSPSLLHIATHGFFLEDLKFTSTGPAPGDQAPGNEKTRLLVQLEKNGIRIESPLLRSGLALAGANDQTEKDNGILTALEVMGLNLWGTKLVVLSACDTGVGEVKPGDGVHGLRRALVLAGAESQMMSLWPVSDRGTRQLMVAYYRRLKQGEERGEALRRVQLQLLGDARRRHPYYWASFIQSGDWRRLEIKR